MAFLERLCATFDEKFGVDGVALGVSTSCVERTPRIGVESDSQNSPRVPDHQALMNAILVNGMVFMMDFSE
jgi:hypothetical protein